MTKESLNKSIFNYHETIPEERGFASYYQNYIVGDLQNLEKERQLRLAASFDRLKYSIPALILALFMAIFRPAEIEYWYDFINNGYNQWVQSLPNYLSIITPSWLIYWSFEVSTWLIVVAAIIYMIYSLAPTLSFKQNDILTPLMPKILNFIKKGEYKYSTNTQINAPYQNQLIPDYDVMEPGPTIIADFDNMHFETTQIQAEMFGNGNQENKLNRFSVFNGYLSAGSISELAKDEMILILAGPKLMNIDKYYSSPQILKLMHIPIGPEKYHKHVIIYSNKNGALASKLAQDIGFIDGLMELGNYIDNSKVLYFPRISPNNINNMVAIEISAGRVFVTLPCFLELLGYFSCFFKLDFSKHFRYIIYSFRKVFEIFDKIGKYNV